MARAVYIAPAGNEARAAQLGLGYLIDAKASPAFAYLQGAGQSITLPEPTTKAAVAAALQPILDAEAAVNAAQQAAMANRETLIGRAGAALQTNADALNLPDPTPANTAFLGIVSPTQAQTLAQVKALTNQANAMYAQVVALTRQNNALIRLALNLLDSTDNTGARP